jgi:2-amino-4-hydroxy-6-hydroxymethyldihydropteridine diphosphokinase
MPQRVYLSLGSNVGDRAANLREAIKQLDAAGRVVSVSSFYETEPVEFTEQPWFLNCAVVLETGSTSERLLAEMLQIERRMGRERTQKKGPRVIDLDILLFGDLIIGSPGAASEDSPALTIPHPAMHQRRFVLEPLAEIAPDARHPVLKKTVRKLLKELPGGQVVRKRLRKRLRKQG